MRKSLVFVSLTLLSGIALAQDIVREQEVDSLYKEDQFYIGVTYNVLVKMPSGLSQNGFSSGFHLGFIKDMPINKKRNWAFGLGLGYSANSINQNLRISEQQSGTYTYELLQSSEFSKNKFAQHLVEVPFELRWRTSTPDSYKFWRIYTGFKLSYVFASNSKFKNNDGQIKHNNIGAFNKLQYGLTLSVGYDSWNAYIHYMLNPVFKDEAQLNGNAIDFRMAKIGIMFYIL